ncbi:hypothetical protein EGT67_21990 [Prescottella agglutinans]|uniref:Uncharacterized protein n=2 Tax=Prescottella agglutinans TaxID=1644129 RepID=A0A438B8E6_9NOCA|nr:hypothetical protein EGT67_21990 [Prescottella agglutinans]
MFVTAGILLVPAAGAASAATQAGVGSVYCGSGEQKSEDGLSCSTSNVNGELGSGSSILGFDLTTLASLFGSISQS